MKYESNISEVIVGLRAKLTKAVDISKLQRTIATYLMASNLRRIHNDGRAVDGSPIGQYNSNHPLYVNPKKSPRKFAPEGRWGAKVFNTGKKAGQPHKTKFFASYQAFRGNIGRQHNFVNLELTKKLRLDWKMAQDGKDWIIGFLSKYGADVSAGNEKRFGKLIWGISAEDRKQIEIIENDFINNALQGA